MATLNVAVTATDPTGRVGSGSATITTTSSGIDDGSQNAPAGPPQRPTLLNPYPFKPSWKVAGVHYAVGPKVAPTKIATASMSITVANTVVDGFDFSSGGGFQVNVLAPGVRIINCNFKAGSNAQVPIFSRSTDTYVGYCTIDGGTNVNTTPGALVNSFGVGLRVEYCWLKNAAGDIVDASEGGVIRVNNNLIENGGGLLGAHGDWLQLGGTNRPVDVDVRFNTVYQTNVAAGSQGFMLECNSPQTIAIGKLLNNTMIAVNTVPPGNFATNFLTGVTQALVTGTVEVKDNFMDKSGSAGGFMRPGSLSAKVIVTGNKNMINGKTVNGDNTET